MIRSIRSAGLTSVAAIALFSVASCGQSTSTSSDVSAENSVESTTPVVLAEYASNFRLNDETGYAHELFYYADVPASVIVTQCNGCEASDEVMTAVSELAERYSEHDIPFYALNSTIGTTRDDIAAAVEENGWTIPVLLDRTQLVGEQIGASRAGEVFIYSPLEGFRLVYHGDVADDASNIAAVLDQLIADEEVTVASSQPDGQLINFPARNEPLSVSYANDVAPVLIENCVECHTTGGIAPWAMTDYETVVGWAPMMREVMMTKRMPPWSFDETIREVEHSRSLSTEEYQTVIRWIEAGTPRGEGEDPLPSVEFEVPEWPLGEPDLVLEIDPFDIPATGVVEYQYPVVANPLTEDHWLRATTIQPGTRDTVHHALTGYMSQMPPPGATDTFGQWEFSTGTYAVGEESMIHPDNSGVPFPAGGAIGFQMHYTPNGREVTDNTRVGFYFHDEQPELYTRSYVIVDPTITIPPGAERHEEVAYVEFPADAELLGVYPHAHYRARSMYMELIRTTGETEIVINSPRYDFNWQFDYRLSEPIMINAGDRLVAHYFYDNSERNFANPDPTSTITWGDQSFEEMMYTRLTYRWVGETTADPMTDTQEELESGMLFGALDDDFDGLVEPEEMNRGMFGMMAAPMIGQFDGDGDGALSREEMGAAMEMMMRMRRSQAGATGGNN